MKTTGAFRGTDGPNPVPPARSLVRTRSERFDRLYEEERTQVQVIPRVFRRLAEAAEQRRKPQPTQTVCAPGSMEWFAANVAPSERWRWGWDHEFESPLLQRRVRKLSVPA
jgi:hypothetical protein